MKVLVFIFISIGMIELMISQCFQKDATEGSCKGKKSTLNSTYYCCYVNYRTNKDKTYKGACVEVRPEDIKKGKHEATIPEIEKGNYSASGWTNEMKEIFLDYSSIKTFDCKSYFLESSILILLLSFLF